MSPTRSHCATRRHTAESPVQGIVLMDHGGGILFYARSVVVSSFPLFCFFFSTHRHPSKNIIVDTEMETVPTADFYTPIKDAIQFFHWTPPPDQGDPLESVRFLFSENSMSIDFRMLRSDERKALVGWTTDFDQRLLRQAEERFRARLKENDFRWREPSDSAQ